MENYIIDDTAHHLPLFSQNFKVTFEYPVEQTFLPWGQLMNRTNFVNPHRMMIISFMNHEPLIKKGGNIGENTAGEVRLPISMFRHMRSSIVV